MDFSPLREIGAVLISLVPGVHRYFDYHHSSDDMFEQANIRELQMGIDPMTALIYLTDKYDL